MNPTEQDRLKFISVAASFKDAEALKDLGSGVSDVVCPECGAKGKRYGHLHEPFELEGFVALSKGGLAGIVARCEACGEAVALPRG